MVPTTHERLTRPLMPINKPSAESWALKSKECSEGLRMGGEGWVGVGDDGEDMSLVCVCVWTAERGRNLIQGHGEEAVENVRVSAA